MNVTAVPASKVLSLLWSLLEQEPQQQCLQEFTASVLHARNASKK